MTKKQFWQTASNWGFLTGAALFAMNLIGWALKLEANHAWAYQILLLAVLAPAIIYTGKRNAKLSGAEGYGYGRAVGFVFAMMMFAGVVYGVGRFLLMNFIGYEYYAALSATEMDKIFVMYSDLPQFDQLLEMRDSMIAWARNPFVLILGGVLELVAKGGVLGLVLCALVYTKPNLFAAAPQQQEENNESGSE